MKSIYYVLLFIFGAIGGFLAIDVGHFLFNRFYIHNMYTMYLVIGCWIGILIRYITRRDFEGY